MSRSTYLTLAIVVCAIEIGIAAFVHDWFVRPYLGDVLAVILVYLAVRATSPLGIRASLAVALAIACVIEIGQFIGILRWLGLRDNALARTILGRGFDPEDFAAYAAGAVLAWSAEAIRRRSAPATNEFLDDCQVSTDASGA